MPPRSTNAQPSPLNPTQQPRPQCIELCKDLSRNKYLEYAKMIGFSFAHGIFSGLGSLIVYMIAVAIIIRANLETLKNAFGIKFGRGTFGGNDGDDDDKEGFSESRNGGGGWLSRFFGAEEPSTEYVSYTIQTSGSSLMPAVGMNTR